MSASSDSKALEDFPVSQLHTIRQIQEGDYRPPYRKATSQAISQYRRYRIAPHQAQRVLQEWYRTINGHHGVSVDVSQVISTAISRRRPDAPQDELSAPTTGSTNSLEEFRRRSLQSSQQESFQPKVCAFYNSREGCRRGATCPFVHLGAK